MHIVNISDLILSPYIIERFEFRQFRVIDRFIEDGKLSILIHDHHTSLLISLANVYELTRLRNLLLGKPHLSCGQEKENLTEGLNKTVPRHPITSKVGLAVRQNITKTTTTTPEKTTADTFKGIPTKHRRSPGEAKTKYSPITKQVKLRTPAKLCPSHIVGQSMEPMLSPQQLKIIAACKGGGNVFYSGGAGDIRMQLIDALIDWL